MELIENIFSIIGATICILSIIALLVFVIIYTIKGEDYRQDYIKSQTPKKRKVIYEYLNNSKMPFRDLLKRGKEDENK